MTKTVIPIVQNILSANDQIAQQNRTTLDSNSIFSLNIMASPGSGKTSFIIQTIRNLAGKVRIGVVEGDTAPVTIDADKVNAAGVASTQATQINTGGDCHLDAIMLNQGMHALDLSSLDLMIVENVGNLVCPASFQLGTHKNVLIASIPEGDDKPYKYPGMYKSVDVLILNKIDLLPYVDFNMQYFLDGVRMLNPDLVHFTVSCKTGEGLADWQQWLLAQMPGSPN
jgi:hydrogenase nickel incorporation protein HypB